MTIFVLNSIQSKLRPDNIVWTKDLCGVIVYVTFFLHFSAKFPIEISCQPFLYPTASNRLLNDFASTNRSVADYFSFVFFICFHQIPLHKKVLNFSLNCSLPHRLLTILFPYPPFSPSTLYSPVNYVSRSAGVISLVSVLMGTVLGGIILRWVRPRPQFVAAYNIFITLFVSAGFLGLTFIGCPKLNVVGPVQG